MKLFSYCFKLASRGRFVDERTVHNAALALSEHCHGWQSVPIITELTEQLIKEFVFTTPTGDPAAMLSLLLPKLLADLPPLTQAAQIASVVTAAKWPAKVYHWTVECAARCAAQLPTSPTACCSALWRSCARSSSTWCRFRQYCRSCYAVRNTPRIACRHFLAGGVHDCSSTWAVAPSVAPPTSDACCITSRVLCCYTLEFSMRHQQTLAGKLLALVKADRIALRAPFAVALLLTAGAVPRFESDAFKLARTSSAARRARRRASSSRLRCTARAPRLRRWARTQAQRRRAPRSRSRCRSVVHARITRLRRALGECVGPRHRGACQARTRRSSRLASSCAHPCSAAGRHRTRAARLALRATTGGAHRHRAVHRARSCCSRPKRRHTACVCSRRSCAAPASTWSHTRARCATRSSACRSCSRRAWRHCCWARSRRCSSTALAARALRCATPRCSCCASRCLRAPRTRAAPRATASSRCCSTSRSSSAAANCAAAACYVSATTMSEAALETCHEILSALQRCVSQQLSVRARLYAGLDVVCATAGA
jgi:hypothetical protein